MALELLGELEHLVLLSVVRLGGDGYGVSLIEELQRHSRRPILRPSVYLALRRLEARNLIRARMGAPEARRGGRARRHFLATALGMKTLRESHSTLTSLWEGVALSRKS
jgi:PadR family transcriptional regulator PadR